MTKVPMKTQGVLLLVCLLAPVLGEVNYDKSVIDLQDLLINVQSALKAFKQDQDEIRKSADARLSKFEKSIKAFKKEVSSSLAEKLDKFELKIDEKLGQCDHENFSALILSKLNKVELQISKLAVGPRDCADIYDQVSQQSGIYTIEPRGWKPFQVYCDMTTDGGGWTVFQKRGPFPGVKENDFYRGWQEYKDGFGDLKAEFWIGLSNISSMTRPVNGDQELRIDMVDVEGERRYAQYKNFKVQDETQKFRLSIGTYSGDAGDSLSDSNLQKFTTHVNDNDQYANNCAVLHQGAWWYKACSYSSLNGLNTRDPQKIKAGQGIWWYHWKGRNFSLAQTEMKFRPMGWTHKNS